MRNIRRGLSLYLIVGIWLFLFNYQIQQTVLNSISYLTNYFDKQNSPQILLEQQKMLQEKTFARYNNSATMWLSMTD